MERVETGALQIGDDWTGLFVRGDDAMFKLKDILLKAADGEELSDMESFVASWLVAKINQDVNHAGTNRDVRIIKCSDVEKE
jgi:hypothetical protein